MKLAFVNASDKSQGSPLSATPFFMAKNLQEQGVELSRITPPTYNPPLPFKLKQWLGKLSGLEESTSFNVSAAQSYARQIAGQLNKLSVQAVLAPSANTIAYLDCKQPIVLWTDALYAGLLGFMEDYSAHSATTVEHANLLTQAALSRVQLAIFSSDWAARSALELYGVSKDKVKVVPFGANIECAHTLFDIRALLRLRSPKLLKLLFIGRDWQRNGGDIVLKVAAALHESGQAVCVDLVGCQPPKDTTLAAYITVHGHIAKQDDAGLAKISQLMREAHFLFVPSRAETYDVVFCEANAFGVPCLTSLVGGIGTIINDNVNGMKFAFEDNVNHYCDYITDLMQNYSQYEELALASFNEYETRLNWRVSTEKVKGLIAAL
jgi:glycosyltransferase involved in cell wall biosynthesis